MKIKATSFHAGGFVRRRIDAVRLRLNPEEAFRDKRATNTVQRSGNTTQDETFGSVPFAEEDVFAQGPVRGVVSSAEPSVAASQRVEQARSDERVRLARELHDGMLQSLTGATLQMDVLSKTLEQDPESARARLCQIKEMIVEEQAALRSWIQKAEPSARSATIPIDELGAALTNMCLRVEWQWGLRAELRIIHGGSISRQLAYEIHRLAQEALSNVGKHACASAAHVDLRASANVVRLAVSDNGNGFPFCGRYGLAELRETRLGPHTLKDRVFSLDGDLVLMSTPSGSRIEMTLPLNGNNGSCITAGGMRRR